MAAITFTQIQARRDALMRSASRCAVIILRPDNTDDITGFTYLVKDPDPGDTPNTNAVQPANAKGGSPGFESTTWKSYSYANLGTAYGLP